MTVIFDNGQWSLPARAVQSYVRDLSATLKMTPEEFVARAGGDKGILTTSSPEVEGTVFWPFARMAYERGLLQLIPANGLPSVNYDLTKELLLAGPPIGLQADFSGLELEPDQKSILGHTIEFPLGVPASILTANASYIRYYAERGFPILTYKTVRSRENDGNEFPQWVCIENARAFHASANGELGSLQPFIGRKGFFPADPATGTMANSFGVPSHSPDWWQQDLREARSYIEEGKQLLIASVMSSVSKTELETLDAPDRLRRIADDFAETAVLAYQAGAQVIELNFSCPNTKGTNTAGLIYQVPVEAAYVASRVRVELGGTVPIIAKIGYLPDAKLREFLHESYTHLDGIVAINTISASVIVEEGGHQTFPKRADDTAGISGWAVRGVAQRMTQQLVKERDELAKRDPKKRLTLFGLGGIMTKEDYLARRATGVDVVEICTGTYFNPFLGFEIRNARGRISVSPSNGIIDAPLKEGSGAQSRSGRSDARGASNKGGESVSRPRSSVQSNGALDSAFLQNAFDQYFEKRTPEQLVNELSERSPELLVYLAGEAKLAEQ